MQDSDLPHDLVAVGRIGVDLYPTPDDLGRPLAEIPTFARSLGGSPANVAVAAARYGLRTALVTRVGADAFGEYARAALDGFDVDTRFVGVDKDWPTPVVFAEVLGPEENRLHFYRTPTAPDLQIQAADVDLEAVAAARLLWVSGTGLCQEPSRTAHTELVGARREGLVLFDLDYRAQFWPSALSARAAYAELLPMASVAIGNQEEVEVAVGYRDPDEAAFALLEAGVRLAVVKRGADGVLARNRQSRVEIPAADLPAVNGLGAGDAFGGAMCLGLLRGWPLDRVIRFAAAAGAVVASRIPCADAMPTYEETEAVCRRQAGWRDWDPGE
jgi:5-dehydro-2-deoxygluconokinase